MAHYKVGNHVFMNNGTYTVHSLTANDGGYFLENTLTKKLRHAIAADIDPKPAPAPTIGMHGVPCEAVKSLPDYWAPLERWPSLAPAPKEEMTPSVAALAAGEAIGEAIDRAVFDYLNGLDGKENDPDQEMVDRDLELSPVDEMYLFPPLSPPVQKTFVDNLLTVAPLHNQLGCRYQRGG